jgi:hypothetical protein
MEIKVSHFEKRNGGVGISYRRRKAVEPERCLFPCLGGGRRRSRQRWCRHQAAALPCAPTEGGRRPTEMGHYWAKMAEWASGLLRKLKEKGGGPIGTLGRSEEEKNDFANSRLLKWN